MDTEELKAKRSQIAQKAVVTRKADDLAAELSYLYSFLNSAKIESSSFNLADLKTVIALLKKARKNTKEVVRLLHKVGDLHPYYLSDKIT